MPDNFNIPYKKNEAKSLMGEPLKLPKIALPKLIVPTSKKVNIGANQIITRALQEGKKIGDIKFKTATSRSARKNGSILPVQPSAADLIKAKQEELKNDPNILDFAKSLGENVANTTWQVLLNQLGIGVEAFNIASLSDITGTILKPANDAYAKGEIKSPLDYIGKLGQGVVDLKDKDLQRLANIGVLAVKPITDLIPIIPKLETKEVALGQGFTEIFTLGANAVNLAKGSQEKLNSEELDRAFNKDKVKVLGFDISPAGAFLGTGNFALDLFGAGKVVKAAEKLAEVAAVSSVPLVSKLAKTGSVLLDASNSILPTYTVFSEATGLKVFEKPAKFISSAIGNITENFRSGADNLVSTADNIMQADDEVNKLIQNLDTRSNFVSGIVKDIPTKDIGEITSKLDNYLVANEIPNKDTIVKNFTEYATRIKNVDDVVLNTERIVTELNSALPSLKEKGYGNISSEIQSKVLDAKAKALTTLKAANEVESAKFNTIINKLQGSVSEEVRQGLEQGVVKLATYLDTPGTIPQYREAVLQFRDELSRLLEPLTKFDDTEFVKSIIDKQPFQVLQTIKAIHNIKDDKEVIGNFGNIVSSNNKLIEEIKTRFGEGLFDFKIDYLQAKKAGIDIKDLNFGQINKLKNPGILFDEAKYMSPKTLSELGITQEVARKNNIVIQKAIEGRDKLQELLSKPALVPIAISKKNLQYTIEKKYNLGAVLKDLKESRTITGIEGRIEGLNFLVNEQITKDKLQRVGLKVFLANLQDPIFKTGIFEQIKSEIRLANPQAKLIQIDALGYRLDEVNPARIFDWVLNGKHNIEFSPNDIEWVSNFLNTPSSVLAYLKESVNIKNNEVRELLEDVIYNAINDVDKLYKNEGGRTLKATNRLYSDILNKINKVVKTEIKPDFAEVVSYVPRVLKTDVGNDMEQNFLRHRLINNLTKERGYNIGGFELDPIKHLKIHLGDVVHSAAAKISLDVPRQKIVKLYNNLQNNIFGNSYRSPELAQTAIDEFEAFINKISNEEERIAAISLIQNYQEINSIKVAEVLMKEDGSKVIKLLPFKDIKVPEMIANMMYDSIGAFRDMIESAVASNGVIDITEIPDRTPLQALVDISFKDGDAIGMEVQKLFKGDIAEMTITTIEPTAGKVIKDFVRIFSPNIFGEKNVPISSVKQYLKGLLSGSESLVQNIAINSEETISKLKFQIEQVIEALGEARSAYMGKNTESEVSKLLEMTNISDIIETQQIGGKIISTINGQRLADILLNNIEVRALTLEESIATKILKSDKLLERSRQQVEQVSQRLEKIGVSEKLSNVAKTASENKEDILATIIKENIKKKAEKLGMDSAVQESIYEAIERIAQSDNASEMRAILKDTGTSFDKKQANLLIKMVEESFPEEFGAMEDTLGRTLRAIASKPNNKGLLLEALSFWKKLISVPRWFIRPGINPINLGLSWSWASVDQILRDGFNVTALKQNNKLAYIMTSRPSLMNEVLSSFEKIDVKDARGVAKWSLDIGTLFMNKILLDKTINESDKLIIKIARRSEFAQGAFLDSYFNLFSEVGQIMDDAYAGGLTGQLQKYGDKLANLTRKGRESDILPFIRFNNYTNNLSLISNIRSKVKLATEAGLTNEADIIEYASELLDNQFIKYEKLGGFERNFLSTIFTTYVWNRTQFGATLWELFNNKDYARRSRQMLMLLNRGQDPEAEKKYGLTDKYGPFWAGKLDDGKLSVYTFGVNPLMDIFQFIRPIAHGDNTSMLESFLDNISIETEILAGIATGYDIKKLKYIDPKDRAGVLNEPLTATGYAIATLKVEGVLESLPKEIRKYFIESEKVDSYTGKPIYQTHPYLNFILDKEPTNIISLWATYKDKFNFQDPVFKEQNNIQTNRFLNDAFGLVMKDISYEIMKNQDTIDGWQTLKTVEKVMIMDDFAEAQTGLRMSIPQKINSGAKLSKNEIQKKKESLPYPNFKQYTQAQKQASENLAEDTTTNK
jgi:hypothetical protein